MSLIIGKEEPDRVVMGADSAGGSPEEFYLYPHLPKIALCGQYLVGSCGSARVGQVLQHHVEWPEPPRSADLLPFLVRELVPEIRRTAEEAGIAPERQFFLGAKTVVLLGIRGELYVLCSDLTVFRSRGVACIGCGRHAAYPVMAALQEAGIGSARQQIEMTLDVVARHVPVVGPPFRLLELTPEAEAEGKKTGGQAYLLAGRA
jgi:hypothetical protein